MSYVSYADRRKKAEQIKQTATMIVIVGTDCFHLKLEKIGFEDARLITAPPTKNTHEVNHLARMVNFLSQEFVDPIDMVPENED